jgi:hypothetical protein
MPPDITTVSPCGELGAQGLADAYQLDSTLHLRQSHVASGESSCCITIVALALLDRFQSRFDRCEVPSPAPNAHHPQATPCLVKGKSATHGEVLHGVILTEVTVAEDACAVQRSILPVACRTTHEQPPNGSAFHLRGYDRARPRERPDRGTLPENNLRTQHRWRPRQVQTRVRRISTDHASVPLPPDQPLVRQPRILPQ